MDEEYNEWLDSQDQQRYYYEMAGSFDSAENKGENNE